MLLARSGVCKYFEKKISTPAAIKPAIAPLSPVKRVRMGKGEDGQQCEAALHVPKQIGALNILEMQVDPQPKQPQKAPGPGTFPNPESIRAQSEGSGGNCCYHIAIGRHPLRDGGCNHSCGARKSNSNPSMRTCLWRKQTATCPWKHSSQVARPVTMGKGLQNEGKVSKRCGCRRLRLAYPGQNLMRS